MVTYKMLSLFLLIGCFLSFNVEGRIYGQTIKMDGMQFEWDSLYHYKTANFNSDGVIEELNAGEDFFLIDSRLQGYYGLNQWLTLFGGAGIRYLSSATLSQTVTNTNLEHFSIGARFGFSDFIGMLGYFDLELIQKAFTNNYFSPGGAPSDDIVLGNDGTSYRLGFSLSKSFASSHFVQGQLDYLVRPSYLSDEMNYDIQYLYQGETLQIGLGFFGIFSLKTHPFSENPNARPEVSRGVTRLFNGVNQEEFAPYAEIGFKLGKMLLTTRASKTLSGVDTDEAFRVGINIIFGVDGDNGSVNRDNVFKEYSNSAKVIKVSPRGNFFKINQGISTNVEKGTQVDIYQSDFFGGNILVGSGIVFSVETDSAVVKLVKIYQKIPIKPGFLVRFK